jgi:type IV pilus assembly protein PilC
MPRFRYTAVAADGEQVAGELDALDETALRADLLRHNLEVTDVRARRKLTEIEITRQRVPQSEIMHFSRQMAAFVRGGIPITDGLEVVADGTGNRRFREILLRMREAIAQGVPFADAVAEHADVWPPYYLGIIRSAELTGRLDVALEQLSGYIERDLEARSKIRAALTYPAVVLGMSVVTVSILTIYVLPKFADFFDSLDARLPLTTRLLVGLTGFTKDFWFLFPATAALVAAAVAFLQKTGRGRRIKDRALLRVPVLREVVLYAVVERLCRILGAMARAGVPLPEAMAAAVAGANNTVFEERLHPAQERMLEGEGIAGPIAGTELFPRAAVQMMRVGENTGTLDQQLENAAQYYSRELDFKLKKLTTLFEPAVIVMMGVIVGFVAIALVQAMYGIYNDPALDAVGR